jgi:ubiquinone/menaquinone biosynthesis C-methylase UbiE
MKLSRDITIKIKFLIDELIPPIIRDSKWFMYVPFKVLFGNKAWIFYEFKNDSLRMSEREYIERYREIEKISIKRETDLNKACIEKIFKSIIGQNILEVGCGRGYLANKLSKKYTVTASDIILEKSLIKRFPKIHFKAGNIEKLPFKDSSFDTVICTHTLEHVQNLFVAISELRRVTRKRLIIVVPKQRPYKYTFDPHLHFFPYIHSLLVIMGSHKNNICNEIGGDLFYIEDK